MTGPWSDADVARAASMRNGGATADAIGAALGRSASAVALRLHRARAAGAEVAMDRTLTRWTPQRTERALAMWHARAATSDIARALGVTPRAVRSLVGRVRETSPWVERRGPRTRANAWSPDEDLALGDVWRAGETAAVLAARLGRTVPAVSNRVSDLRVRGADLPRRHPPRPP